MSAGDPKVHLPVVVHLNLHRVQGVGAFHPIRMEPDEAAGAGYSEGAAYGLIHQADLEFWKKFMKNTRRVSLENRKEFPVSDTVFAFTFQPVQMILNAGGSGIWVINNQSLNGVKYVVGVRNRNRALVEGVLNQTPEAHRSAFILGKYSGWSPSPTWPGRKLLEFSEYALIDVPNASTGRSPIRYGNLADLGIDPATLDWRPMPPRASLVPASQPASSSVSPPGGEELDAVCQRFRHELADMLQISGERIAITVDATGTGKLLFHL